MEKMDLYYVEIIVENFCDDKCDLDIDYLNNTQTESLTSIIDTLIKWKEYINFKHIGITCGKLMNNEVIINLLATIRNYLTDTKIVFITDEKMILDAATLLEKLIELEPSKLCIVLPDDWVEYTKKIKVILKQTNYRFLKKGNEPIDGLKFILLSRSKVFDVELYHHVMSNPPHKAADSDFLNRIGVPHLFQFYNNRKHMIVLSAGKIFKCLYVYRLWKYWTVCQNEIRNHIRKCGLKYADIQRAYEEIIVETIICDINQIELINKFKNQSSICNMCTGCVECIVFPKVE